jgi:hypothetical protein
MTNTDYQTYKGVDITATKRYSNHWQAAVAVTIQNNPQFFPAYSATYFGSGTTPTGIEYTNGISTISKYVTKLQGSYTFKWDIAASVNFNWNQGATRTISINGPGQVYGGTTGQSISYSTLQVYPSNHTRFDDLKILDAGVQKTFRFRGGKNRIKLMLDGFNLTNNNAITGYNSGNLSDAPNYAAPSQIVPPRIFRVGATFNF